MSVRPTFYIVLGPFRSGTSLISRLAQKLGANPGPESELYEPTEWNPSGYIQRPDITAFNTQLIINAGGTLTNPPSPTQIAQLTHSSDFKKIDLKWCQTESTALAKDPRFCFTLYAWARHGLFDKFNLKLIRITRDINKTASSALAHYDVKNYCGNSLEIARQVISRYHDAALWHQANLDAPCHCIDYETLIAEPQLTVPRLAKFMDVVNPAIIASAISATLEGKSRISHDLSG